MRPEQCSSGLFRDILELRRRPPSTRPTPKGSDVLQPRLHRTLRRHADIGQRPLVRNLELYHPDGAPMPHDTCPMAVALKRRIIPGAEAIAERPRDGTRIGSRPIRPRCATPTVRSSAASTCWWTSPRQTGRDVSDLARSSSRPTTRSSRRTWTASSRVGTGGGEALRLPVRGGGRKAGDDVYPSIAGRGARVSHLIRRGERVDHYETVRRRKDGTLIECRSRSPP